MKPNKIDFFQLILTNFLRLAHKDFWLSSDWIAKNEPFTLTEANICAFNLHKFFFESNGKNSFIAKTDKVNEQKDEAHVDDGFKFQTNKVKAKQKEKAKAKRGKNNKGNNEKSDKNESSESEIAVDQIDSEKSTQEQIVPIIIDETLTVDEVCLQVITTYIFD